MRNNNFDALRFGLALIVVFFHASLLSQTDSLEWIRSYFSATFAVQAFFTVSGFLIFMSYERSRSLGDYAEKRARRIFPAYACVLIVALFLGSWRSTLPPADYWSSSSTWRYLAYNLLFMNYSAPTLPGVFQGQYSEAVNGSLWTLKIELIFYAAVPLLVWACRRFPAKLVLPALYAGSTAYRACLEWLADSSGNELYSKLAKQFPGQLSFFVAGAAAYLWFKQDRRVSGWLFLAAIVSYQLLDGVPLIFIGPALVALIATYIAVWAPWLGAFGRHGDFSYGIYIYHFPIVQTFISLGLFALSPWGAFAGLLFVVSIVAILSWHLVEKPILHRA